MDKDETSIGGLKHPPKATKNLFYASLLFDAFGLGLSLIVGVQFFLLITMYMIASRAYSYKGIRLKKMPIVGFLTVVFFQGAFTFYMVALACSAYPFQVTHHNIIALIASSLLIGGVYPLTQIYQHKSDVENGDYTISYQLGYIGTFVFSSCMFLLSAVSLYIYFTLTNMLWQFLCFQLFLLPVIIYFLWWFYKVKQNNINANFENTMRMNFLASICVNFCFILISLIKNIA